VKRHPFRWIALAVGIAVAAFAVVLAVNVSTDPRADSNSSRLLGKAAPPFAFTDLAGKKVTSADWRSHAGLPGGVPGGHHGLAEPRGHVHLCIARCELIPRVVEI